MSWLGVSRELGLSLLDLLRAEAAALGSDLGSSAQKLLKIGGIFAIALFLLFWSIGILAYLAVELLTGLLPAWGAVSTVFAVFLLAAVICGLVGKAGLSRLESPTVTLSRRFDEHRQWWESRIVGSGPKGSKADFRSRVEGEEHERS